MEIQQLTEKVIGSAFTVHNQLGFGFLEKVYENALAMELINSGITTVDQQRSIPVFYKGVAVGQYFADLFVDNRLIVEVKSVLQLIKDHEIQLVHYLTATNIDHGLLVNFGPSVVVKHKYRIYVSPHTTKSSSKEK